MAVAQEQIDYIVGQLVEFGAVRAKRMFGGVGFFHQDLMFAMLGKEGIFRLKADEVNEGDFKAVGMDLMHHGRGTMPYWEVPESVVSDPSQLVVWAQKAFDAALRSKK